MSTYEPEPIVSIMLGIARFWLLSELPLSFTLKGARPVKVKVYTPLL